jgi:hypothetical protein
LPDNRIRLNICPTSNVMLGRVPSLAALLAIASAVSFRRDVTSGEATVEWISEGHIPLINNIALTHRMVPTLQCIAGRT